MIGQSKQFFRWRNPEPSDAEKETTDIDILIASMNGSKNVYGNY